MSDKAEEYRVAAEKVRLEAAEYSNPVYRKEMLIVADRWDAMADEVEKSERHFEEIRSRTRALPKWD